MRVAIVAGRFNGHVTGPLLDGARATLRDHGLDPDTVPVVWVPGAFEIPLTAKRLAASGTVDAVVCLGAVIRGDTAHFEYVAGPCAAGIAQAALDTASDRVRGPHHQRRTPGPRPGRRPGRQQGRRGGRHRPRDGRRAAHPPGPGGSTVLSLVLPKGSLERATLQLFEDADLAVQRSSDVEYRAGIDDRGSPPCGSCDPRRSPGTSPRAASTSASPAGTGSRRPPPTSCPSASCTTRRTPATTSALSWPSPPTTRSRPSRTCRPGCGSTPSTPS